MEIYAVKLNGLDNPVGFDYDMLQCSWKICNSNGKKQRSAKIQVATDKELRNILWEKEGDLNSLGESLDIFPEPCTRYYYQITVTSDAGEVAKSEIHFFETAKMEQLWQAKWIGVQDGDTHPEFTKAFSAANVKSARLYICGLGIFRFWQVMRLVKQQVNWSEQSAGLPAEKKLRW